MAEYYKNLVKDFLAEDDESILSALHISYANDGYSSQYTSATKAWAASLRFMREEMSKLVMMDPKIANWAIVLEYPLYRLRIRIDLILLSQDAIYVIELKTGSIEYLAGDKAQAEDYALDLRDFHSGSNSYPIFTILWCPEKNDTSDPYEFALKDSVSSVICVGKNNLTPAILSTIVACPRNKKSLNLHDWLSSKYKPVPSIIAAATAIFSNHGVEEISNSDADNLAIAGEEMANLIQESKQKNQHAVIFLSGVPGSGKTLAGLNIVHDAIQKGVVESGEIVYLSGNTPLVTVLREALALDQVRQHKLRDLAGAITLKSARANMRATIQHVMDFLNQYLKDEVRVAPVDRVVIFDEAQRAWDKRQGKIKFDREASEPELILSIMERHDDWAVVVALIGNGQEINDGEYGLSGWGDALRLLASSGKKNWIVHGSQKTLSDLKINPEDFSFNNIFSNEKLHLNVPQRSYRAPELSKWVDFLIKGESTEALKIHEYLIRYPIVITRDIEKLKRWLIGKARGRQRFGLLASSGAKRLRADGFGEVLSATDGASIAHWYLQPEGDIRSSFALEVPANEYTSQGLEIDYVGLCWGGDFLRESGLKGWTSRKLSGNRWNIVKTESGRQFIENSYRVLLTRARQGMGIWIPPGSKSDKTRSPKDFDAVYNFLRDCGAEVID